MLNKWKDIPLWVKIIIIIPLFIFPLAVHLLFIIPAISKYCEAQWGAGDLLGFCGGYLAFLGPTMLSFVALKQNEEFKKSNDKAQARLERISLKANELNVRANELSLISKIIDCQQDRYRKIEHLLHQYADLMTRNNFCKIFVIDPISCTIDGIERRKVEFQALSNEANTICVEIIRLISLDKRKSSIEDKLLNYIQLYYFTAFVEINGQIPKGKKEEDSYLNSLDKCRFNYCTCMVKYLSEYSDDIDKAMYTTMTLEEVRNLFNPPKKENTNNGKNENGIPESDRPEC